MKHPGLSMHVLADGSVALCKMFAQEAKDTAEISDENAVFFLDAPILFDKNGEILKAAYQIEKGQGISEITIKMDASWLMDEGRAYPVTVDPTVRIEKKQTTNKKQVHDSPITSDALLANTYSTTRQPKKDKSTMEIPYLK